jgi:hypothetical protein
MIAEILMCESETSTDRDLCTNDTISTIELGSKHVHGSTLSMGNTMTATEEFTDDGTDSTAAHKSEAMTTVGGDDIVFFSEGVFNSDGESFLAGGEMAETADLLLLVESVCSHFHATEVFSSAQFLSRQNCPRMYSTWVRRIPHSPNSNHIIIHLLQLPLRRLHCI